MSAFTSKGGKGPGPIVTTKLLLRKVSNYYILKDKAPTAKPFVDICSIKESLHFKITAIYDQNRKNPKTQTAYRVEC